MTADAFETFLEETSRRAWDARPGDEVPVPVAGLRLLLQRVNRPRNGWTNHETWVSNLWLTNDRGTFEAAREAASAGADELKDFIEHLAGLDDLDASLASDLLGAALAEVDLDELRQALSEAAS
ncbi:MAG: hypothetical protein IT186_15980 [Acidobacteria bacterium]|nr:hypothetical protein [Acidobacteriota bacterium]